MIDILTGVAPNGVPPGDANDVPPEESDGFAAFVELLEAVAGEQDEAGSTGDSEEAPADSWTTPIVFPPPFIAQIEPQEPESGSDLEPVVDAMEEESAPFDLAFDAAPEASADDEAAAFARTQEAAAPARDEGNVARAETPGTVAAAAARAPGVMLTREARAVTTDAPSSIEGRGDAPRQIGVEAEAVEPESPSPAPAPAPAVERPAPTPGKVHAVGRVAGEAAATDAEAVPLVETNRPERAAESAPAEGILDREAPVADRGTVRTLAARLARALEHATATTHAASDDTAGHQQHGSEGERSGDGQPSFGDGLRNQPPPSAPAPRHEASANQRHEASASHALNMAPSLQHEARVSGPANSPLQQAAAGTPFMPSAQDVTSQLVQSLRLQFRDGIGEAVLKLKPEHLGAVSISLRVENGGIKADVRAEVAAVRQWLESQQDTLRSALAEHGLRLDRFVVDPEGHRQGSPRDARDEAPRRRPRPAPRAGQPVFEVVV